MNNYNELMIEKKRLEATLLSKRLAIKENVETLKDEFIPVTHALATLMQFFSRDKHNPLVNAGVNFAGDVLVKKILLGRAGWLTKLIVPYMVKNYSSHLINNNLNKRESNFLQKFGERLKK